MPLMPHDVLRAWARAAEPRARGVVRALHAGGLRARGLILGAGAVQRQRPADTPAGVLEAALALVAIVLTALAWTMSSPLGSSADEQDHIIYAWGVATGQVTPWNAVESEGTGGTKYVDVTIPNGIQRLPPACYALEPEQPACATADSWLSDDQPTESTSRMDRYPQPYYLVTGLTMRLGMALGLDGPGAVTAARIVSGILDLAMLLTALVVLGRRTREGTASALGALALTPSSMSLFAAVNPNGWEIVLALLVAACVASVRIDRVQRRPRSSRLLVALVLGALLLGLARPASVAWLLLLLAVLVLPVRGEGPLGALRYLGARWSSAIAVATAPGVAWYLYANASRGGGADGKDVSAWMALPAWERTIAVVEHFGVMVRASYTDLGWSDTSMPELFFVLWLGTCCAALGAAASRRDRRLRSLLAAAGVLLGACLVIGLNSNASAFAWQGRYLLAPLLAAAVLVLAGDAVPRPAGGQRPASIGMVVLAAVVGWLGLVVSLNRYLYGFTEVYEHFSDLALASGDDGDWKTTMPTPMILALGAVAALAWIGLAWIALAARPRAEVGTGVTEGPVAA